MTEKKPAKKAAKKAAKKKVALVVGNTVRQAADAAAELDLKGRDVGYCGPYSPLGPARADEIYNCDRVLDRIPPSTRDTILERLKPGGKVIDVD